MQYQSTRGGIEPVGFCDAVMMGLADDGGLVIPMSIPDVRDRLELWRELPYADLACEVIAPFVADIPEAELRELIHRTYGDAFQPDVAPTVAVGDLWVQELWHGPTLAFKDVALQWLGNLFEYILSRRGGGLNILGATSGDTGSAAIYGCRGRAGLDIFVMHPAGRVSPIQQRQMTTVLDENVHNIALEGSFDDCQRIMKTIASDLDFKRRHRIGAVNSVNWARVLAQVVYYFKGAFDVCRQTGAEQVRFCVPTGNFGDILAGWYAMRMGAPIGKLILATNENDILARFFNSGEYSLGKVYHTLSPSMDIQVASNFERYLFYRLGQDADALQALMARFAETGALEVQPGPDGQIDADFASAPASRPAVLETIGRYHRDCDYVLDPHTACGVAVAERFHEPDAPMICLATAHPAKFPSAIAEATGRDDLARHRAIEALMDKPTRCVTLPDDIAAVRAFIEETLSSRQADSKAGTP